MMKASKMLELVENLKVGEKVVIEKFKDHLFVEKFPSKQTEWIPSPSDNINKHGVDLSILNDEDWFYVEVALSRWIFKGKDIFSSEGLNIFYNLNDSSLYVEKTRLTSDKDKIFLLRKATPEDLEPFFEKHPVYAPVKVGDIGIFYDYLELEKGLIYKGDFNIHSLKSISNNKVYPYENIRCNWKHFFKVSENETIAEIKERFLKQYEIN